MVGDYISREAAENAFCKYMGFTSGRVALASELIFAKIPAADVVEVVRCRDCIYWRGENELCKGICIDFDADGYCSEGKRKDGGKDNG